MMNAGVRQRRSRSPASRPAEDEYLGIDGVRGRNLDRFIEPSSTTTTCCCAPTAQLTARKVEDWNAAGPTDGDRYAHGNFAGTYMSHVMLFNWLLVPAFCVPAGFVDGLPVGLQIVGRPGSEAKMFRIAQAFQKAFPRDENPNL